MTTLTIATDQDSWPRLDHNADDSTRMVLELDERRLSIETKRSPSGALARFAPSHEWTDVMHPKTRYLSPIPNRVGWPLAWWALGKPGDPEKLLQLATPWATQLIDQLQHVDGMAGVDWSLQSAHASRIIHLLCERPHEVINDNGGRDAAHLRDTARQGLLRAVDAFRYRPLTVPEHLAELDDYQLDEAAGFIIRMGTRPSLYTHGQEDEQLMRAAGIDNPHDPRLVPIHQVGVRAELYRLRAQTRDTRSDGFPGDRAAVT